MLAGVCLLTRCAATAIQDLQVLIMPYTAVKIKLQSLQTALTTLIQMEHCRIHIVLHQLLTAKRENAVRKFLYGKTIILIFQ